MKENSIEEDIKIVEDFIDVALVFLPKYSTKKVEKTIDEESYIAIKHILADYQKLKEEFKAVDHECSRLEQKEVELEKTIDLMAEFIEDEFTVDKLCTKKGCYADNYINGHCEKCLNCIKQYFINKAKEVK